MPKDDKAKKTPEKRAKRRAQNAGQDARQTADVSARGSGSAERPPESAEDFGHVLRRLMVAREARREDVLPGR
jgi:hypothetical protein